MTYYFSVLYSAPITLEKCWAILWLHKLKHWRKVRLEASKRWLLRHPEKAKEFRKRGKANFGKKHPERVVAQRRKYLRLARKRNPEKWRARDKANYDRNRPKKLLQKRIYQPRALILQKQRRLKNPQAARDKQNARFRNNPQARIKSSLSVRLRRFIKKNGRGTSDFVGCSAQDLMLFLQAQFLKGMSWNNYGKWEIDHKIPCSKFDLTKPYQVRQCFHFSNLQPMWKKDNRVKQDKIGPEFGNQQQCLPI